MKVRTVKLRHDGMFTALNQILHHLYLSELGQYAISIDCSNSCYKDPSLEGKPWHYFFEDCYQLPPESEWEAVDPSLLARLDQQPNLIRTRKQTIKGKMILQPPADRARMQRVIDKFIKIKPAILEKARHFRQAHLSGPVVCAHIRGAGRIGGGTMALRRAHDLTDGVPLASYFAPIDSALANAPDARLLVCSDSQTVIDHCADRYADKLITYAAIRSDFGEMHNRIKSVRAKNHFRQYPRYQLGEDVLIEALSMAECDFFIHGNSNVSNFVLCKNPALPHIYIYDEQSRQQQYL